MPRPTRIQNENAFYHVMNRGRGRKAIFHNKAYYQSFLKTLEEASQQKKGRQRANFPRKLAIYCCQQLGYMSLKSIATLFNMQHEGSVSPAISAIKRDL